MGLFNRFKNRKIIKSNLDQGELFRQDKQYDKALECYNNVLELDPNNSKVLYKKGWILSELKRDEEALKCYGAFLKFRPKDEDGWLGKTNSLKNLNILTLISTYENSC